MRPLALAERRAHRYMIDRAIRHQVSRSAGSRKGDGPDPRRHLRAAVAFAYQPVIGDASADACCGRTDGDFVAADDRDPPQGVPKFEVLGTMRDPREGRPLVLVTGVGGRAGRELAW